MIVVFYTRIFHILFEVNIHIKTDYIARSMFGSTQEVVVLICVWQIFLFVYLSFVFCSRSRKFAVEELSCVNVITYFRAVFVFFLFNEWQIKIIIITMKHKNQFSMEISSQRKFQKIQNDWNWCHSKFKKKVRIDMHKF